MLNITFKKRPLIIVAIGPAGALVTVYFRLRNSYSVSIRRTGGCDSFPAADPFTRDQAKTILRTRTVSGIALYIAHFIASRKWKSAMAAPPCCIAL